MRITPTNQGENNMKLHDIIKQLGDASGTLEKQAILDSHKGNELLKEFVRATLDPAINYYQSKLPKGYEKLHQGTTEFGVADLRFMEHLSNRVFTGSEASNRLAGHAAALNAEGRDLLAMMVSRKLGKTNVGETMALKTWPGLFFTVPYQRCSLLDAKARERFGKLKRFYVQTKADGSFAYVVKRLNGSVDVITRQGSKYPQWFAEKLAYGLAPGKVLVGELLVDETQFVEGNGDTTYHLDRKTANGLLNSALKDGEKFDLSKYSVRMEAWDLLTQQEFEDGKSNRSYEERLDNLHYEVDKLENKQVTIIFTEVVSSLEEAFAIYQEHLQRGLEGCIIKDPASLWKDGTAKDMVKLKIKFQVEMRVTGVYEGEGKAAGMLGGIYIQSEDGLIECACGSGFSDAQRKQYWDYPELIGNAVVTVEANDITQARDDRKKPSLSLPIFVEIRADKQSLGADKADRIYAQLEAAKQG
jgi:DNA ligase-1